MPIRDLSYAHWTGTRSERSPAWILARAQLRLILARRSVRFLLVVSALFTLAWSGMIYLETRVPSGGPWAQISQVTRLDARSFWRFFVWQRLAHLLLCVAAGADLIALDRRHKALQIYLARPLRASDYLLGKGLALAVLLSLATWVPGLLLVVLRIALGASIAWLAPQPWLPLSILGYSAALIGGCTLLTLAVSSLSASSRLAGVQLLAFVILTAAAGDLLSTLTRAPVWQLVSFNANLDRVASAVFAEVPGHDVPLTLALAALVALAAGCAALLATRIRPIEVVGSS